MLLLAGLWCNFLVFGGFTAQTFVKMHDNDVAIEDLNVGDAVICYDMQNNYVEKEVTHKKFYRAQDCVCIVVQGAKIITSQYQKLYSADQKKWKMARDLAPGDLLLGQGNTYVPVQGVISIAQAIDLYDISVKDCHNFLISKDGILVHNFLPAVSLGLSWALGMGSAQLASVCFNIGSLCFASAAGVMWWNKKERDWAAEEFLKNKNPEAINGSCATSGYESEATSREFTANSTVVASVSPHDGRVASAASGAQAIAQDLAGSAAATAIEFAKNRDKKKPKAEDKEKDRSESKAGTGDDDGGYRCKHHIGCRRRHPYGLYEDAGYHHAQSKGSAHGGKGSKSPAPTDGQLALDYSIPVVEGGFSAERIGLSCGQIVVLKFSISTVKNGEKVDIWHGYTANWDAIKGAKQAALKRQRWANWRGKMTWPSWAL